MKLPDPKQQHEAELIRRILAGERELFHELILPYQLQVYKTLYAMLRNAADAEDATQEVVLKAYRSLGSFRAESKFSTWIIAIAMNYGRDMLDKASRRKEQSLDEEMESYEGDFTPVVLTDWRPVPNEALQQKEIAELVKQAVASLPQPYREVLTLRDIDEMEVPDVAAILGISSNLVRVRLHRARTMMQKQLAPVLGRYAPPLRRTWWGGWR